MVKIQDTDIPYLEFAEAAAPGTPASGIVRTYAKADGKMYQKDDAGTESGMGGVPAGAVTSSGLTQATARLLGRTTASTGAIEEITVGSGLSLAAGALTATGSGPEFSTGDDKVATAQGTTSTSATDLATTGPSVTVTIGASGKAKVTVTAQIDSSIGAEAAYCGFVVSGANTIAYQDLYMALGGGFGRGSGVTLLTGLSTGATTFKMQYRSANSGSTATFRNREIIVEPVL